MAGVGDELGTGNVMAGGMGSSAEGFCAKAGVSERSVGVVDMRGVGEICSSESSSRGWAGEDG